MACNDFTTQRQNKNECSGSGEACAKKRKKKTILWREREEANTLLLRIEQTDKHRRNRRINTISIVLIHLVG